MKISVDFPSVAHREGTDKVAALGQAIEAIGYEEIAVFDHVVMGYPTDERPAPRYPPQMPVLEARNGFPKKVKPLVRLSERDTAAFCILTGIDYLVDECPMSAGNKHLGYKDALNQIELTSPGSKSDFYFSFLRRAAVLFRDAADGAADGDVLVTCTRCGAPSGSDVCAFCRLVETASTQPVELTRRPRTEAEAPP